MKNFSYIFFIIFFVVSCGGGGGAGQGNSPIASPNPTINSFASSLQTVTVGESVTLTWSSINASACQASGDWSNSISINGSLELTLNEVKVYNFTLTCSGSAGTTSAVSEVSVEVVSAQSPSIDSFEPSSSSIIVNESVTLTWTTSATTVCSAKGDWEGSKALNGSETLQLNSIRTYEFILECTGVQEVLVTDSVTVLVNEETNQDLDVHIINDGKVADIWGGDDNLFFFDELNNYQSCKSNVCPSVDWSFEDSGTERGEVLEVVYTADAGHAGLVVGPTAAVNLSDYSEGSLSFDIKVINKGSEDLREGFKLKVETTQTLNSSELLIDGINGDGSWEEVNFPVSKLTEGGDLELSSITVPIVLFPSPSTAKGVVYQLDNVRYTGIKDGATPP
jgi:PKD repeat protein